MMTCSTCPFRSLQTFSTSYTWLLNLLADLAPWSASVARASLVQTCLGRRSLTSVARQTGCLSPTRLRTLVGRLLAGLSSEAWEEAFNAALRSLWEPLLRGRSVLVVGDETLLPFWGRPTGELVGELRGGPPKNGATRFFAYVTLCALWRGRRFPLAVGRWRADQTLAEVLERLAPPLLAAGLQVRGWLWDRGGATVALLRRWRDQGQGFIVAAPRRGDKTGVAARLTALEAVWGEHPQRPPTHSEPYTLRPEKGRGQRPLTVTLVVAWEPVKSPRDQRRQRSLRRARTQPGQRWRAVAWFTDGETWRSRGAVVQQVYRQRQSIESSYRQSHASRGRTSSRDARYRFVLFAVSLLLQALWRHLERPAGQGHQWLIDQLEEWGQTGRFHLLQQRAEPPPQAARGRGGGGC